MGKYCDEKRGRRRDERGRTERAGEERNCTARVSYRVITILGHFYPLPPLSPPHITAPASLSPSTPTTSSDIKLFIVHNGASSFARNKKKKKEKRKEKLNRGTGKERSYFRKEKGGSRKWYLS